MDSDDTKKSNRQMTPEMLEKLAVAREKANKVHSDRAAIKRKEKELKDKMWTDRKQKLEQVEEPVVKTKKTKKKTAKVVYESATDTDSDEDTNTNTGNRESQQWRRSGSASRSSALGRTGRG